MFDLDKYNFYNFRYALSLFNLNEYDKSFAVFEKLRSLNDVSYGVQSYFYLGLGNFYLRKHEKALKYWFEYLKREKILTDKEFEALDKEQKDIVMASMKFAEESPNPESTTLEEDVFAP